MATLTVTARGQVTFRKEVLQHLGIKPGEKMEVELMPGGQATVHAVRKGKSIMDIYGILEGKSKKHATLEEIEEATQRGWAGLI
jgi:bifunctional DNA-binding transcriptional regulator/antitoxin component of YhaV-PrlF toxin-antitoxin module